MRWPSIEGGHAKILRRIGREGDRHPFDSSEIVVTAEKILRRDLFGLRKYVSTFGLELSTIEVRAAEDRVAELRLRAFGPAERPCA